MFTLKGFIEKAAERYAGIISIAAAEDENVLEAACQAKKEKIANSVLVGDEKRIRALLEKMGEDPGDFSYVQADNDREAAEKAVALVREDKANLLMKGHLSTSDMMRAVIHKDTGITEGKLLSHVMFYEPEIYKLHAMTDGGMIPYPDKETKIKILENCIDLMRSLGWEHLNAACVCATEVVNPKIQSLVDAAEIAAMKDHWKERDVDVFGPVGLDLALGKIACKIKDYKEPGGGDADIMLFSNYEAGNCYGKACAHYGNALNAGLIVGAKVPIILVSRSDSADAKLASIAIGALVEKK